ncbi:hypothetical protein ACOBM3_15980 [Enterobacter hormaechei]|uniref:hypothetical protein n=1 Tax=Enterobacter hormaechei TaxID=158836 RepID=UPI00197CD949|nr:hypothetical protein [Enterobacter hormaechei]MBN4796469.1 hypothetical protein [Enterobacter hormaechei]MBN4820580.1 hypothetical protein [Enterobacter hormaechei]
MSELVKIGHERAADLRAACGTIAVAKLISDLATQLDVQLARSNVLAAENAGLKSAIEKHADSYIMCGYCRTERDGKSDDVCEVLDSIPATDAFLSGMRAAAVDEVCLKISNAIINCYQDEQVGLDAAATICGDFAAQLRKGVQS